jgi:uncharacterized membrane protein YccC
MVSPLQIVGGVLATVISGLIVRVVWRRWEDRLDEQTEHEDWYADAVSHCEQGLHALRNFEATGNSNPDETRMEMRATGSQLARHAGDSAGMDVDNDVVEALREASEACQSVNNARISLGDRSEWNEAFEQAREALTEARDLAEEHL